MDSKIMQISVEGQTTGLVGLESMLAEVAQWAKGREEAEITAELLNRVEKRNYIPSKIREVYGKALLREYKKYMGQEVKEETSGDLQVIILGPGCVQCSSLESGVRDVMAEMNLAGDLMHVTDLKEIGRYGVMGAPALVINNKIVSVGIVPNKIKIKQWLQEATDNQKAK
jgi:hypothetical protein